ncbi:FAD-dependent oxidoreductase [Allokutzneria albata]|uniref:FAD-dependent oxidoreductase n=1 Tax=Allokutzneria albata TaxID=211114 RepID=UPI0004C377AD|nr:FAD-dependent oxidoreductase [Allokutzneria albata]
MIAVRGGLVRAFGTVLRRPCTHLHWAGAETAAAFQTTMDGAVRAGERAADEVLVQLSAPTTQEPDHAADT